VKVRILGTCSLCWLWEYSLW